MALGLSRFVQGVSSAATWAAALAWVAVSAPRERRGQALGTVFGLAVLGFVAGPMFGGIADVVGIRWSFVGVAFVAAALALVLVPFDDPPTEERRPGAILRALRDRAFVVGLWLNTLPALFFGVLDVLVPLRLDDAGYGAIAIAAVFVTAGLVEVVVNPVVGRVSDQRGRLLPVRVFLGASIAVACAIAFATEPLLVAALVVAASVSFGGFYTPGMALVADRADRAGLAQGIGFGVTNSAWAIGAVAGACDRRRPGAGLRRSGSLSPVRRALRAHARGRLTRRSRGCVRPEKPRQETLERPGCVERLPPVVAAVDQRVVAPLGVHRQPRLDREPAVVPCNELVDLVEAPGFDELLPGLREPPRATPRPQAAPAPRRAPARERRSWRRSRAGAPCTAAARRARPGSSQPRAGSSGGAVGAARL